MHQMQAQSLRVGCSDDGALVFEQGFCKIFVLAKAHRLEWMLHGGRASIHIRKSVKHDEIRTDLHFVMKDDVFYFFAVQHIVMTGFGGQIHVAEKILLGRVQIKGREFDQIRLILY